jgi:uncharacterized protein YukE
MGDNSLIAAPVETQTATTGIGVLDSIDGFKQSVESGTWIDVALAGAGGAFEAFSLGIDPVGTLLSYGVSWLLEHVEPLQQLLEDLTGDADVLHTHASTWENMATEAWAMGEELTSIMDGHQEEWIGDAADAFRSLHGEFKFGVDGLGSVFDSMRAATSAAAGIVQTAYELVRDLIAELISILLTHLPAWLGLIAATAGAATPLCVIDALIIIVNIAGLIFSIVTALVQTYMNLQVLLGD